MRQVWPESLHHHLPPDTLKVPSSLFQGPHLPHLIPLSCSGEPGQSKNIFKVSYFSLKSLENFIAFFIIFLVC